MKAFRVLALAAPLYLLGLGMGSSAWAQSGSGVVAVAGQDFDAQIQLAGQTLVLNGAGASSILSSRTHCGGSLPSCQNARCGTRH